MNDSHKIITIDGVEYENYIEQEPESNKGNLDNFKFFYKIFPENYNEIAPNTIIAYQQDNNQYNLGFLLKHIQPNIFILKNSRFYNIWSVVVSGSNNIYVKDINLHRRENRIKDKLYEIYNNK
tara:strand:+ start:313 stop:681 length:369 start_codon:yes stop_codon:yes gene_type:complete